MSASASTAARKAAARTANLPEIADDELDAILAWGDEDAAPEPPATPTPEPIIEFPDEAPPAASRALIVPGEARHGDALYAAAYDSAAEEKDYSRSLMGPKDLALLKADIEDHGFMTIDNVRELIIQNTVKESQEARGETYAVDPELMMLIDTRTNFRVFIAGDNVYTREELLEHYPFDAFHTTPEDVFAQQEIGVFPPKKYADPAATAAKGEDAYEYVARDLGDDEEFIMIEDLVGRAARKNYKMKRSPVRVVKTKVFLAKDKWDDFTTMKRFVKSFTTFVTPLMLEGGDSSAKALTYLFGGQAFRGGGPLAIQDEAGLVLERERAAQAREQAVLRALEAKARALRENEEELRQREEDLYRSLGMDPPDRAPRDFMAEASAPGDASEPDDSVPL